MMRKRIDLAGDATARQELWRQVAGLLERDVGDVDEAIAACVSILDESPQDDQALETLARLYEQQGRHRQRLEILERRLALPGRGATAERVVLLRADRGAAGRAAGRSGRGARPLARGAGGGARRSRTRSRRWSASWRRRRTAACGWRRRRRWSRSTSRAGRYAELAAVVRVYVDAQTDARARLEQLMRLAALEETPLGDKEASRATTPWRSATPCRSPSCRRCSTRSNG